VWLRCRAILLLANGCTSQSPDRNQVIGSNFWSNATNHVSFKAEPAQTNQPCTKMAVKTGNWSRIAERWLVRPSNPRLFCEANNTKPITTSIATNGQNRYATKLNANTCNLGTEKQDWKECILYLQ
jgi:hypothetical protein